MGMNEASGRSGRHSQAQELRQRISSLEVQAAGLGLAQVMTRSFAGEIHYWSRGMERLYGFSAAEAMGRISHQRAAGARRVDRRAAPSPT